jgi:hypothetical protein
MHPVEGNEEEEEEMDVEDVVAPLPQQQHGPVNPNRSPSPPRSLHRSTTGKGIAFTEEDVTFLVRYMTYRR